MGAGPWTAVTQRPNTLRGGVEEGVAAPGRVVSWGRRSHQRRPDGAAQLPLRELRETEAEPALGARWGPEGGS